MNFGLSEDTIKRFRSAFAVYPEIEEVVIYGSRAKGNYREGSDIDFALKGEQLTEDFRKKIWLALDELNTPYLIDVSVYSHLTSDSLIEHIDRVGKIFYQRNLRPNY